MPFNNYDSRHFSAVEQTALTDAMSALEAALTDKLANLSPEERQRFGSVNESNKLIISKVKDYHSSEPNLSSTDVDWEEFERDFASRAVLQNTIQRLQSLIDGLNSSKILHDWDNYQASLTDYEFAKYKNNRGAIGFATKVKELAQFFTGGNNGSTMPPVDKDTTGI